MSKTMSRQERAYSAASLACLEISSRNEEAINSTRNRIYSPKDFLLPSLSTSIHFTCFWIDLIRVLATTRNTGVGAVSKLGSNEDVANISTTAISY